MFYSGQHYDSKTFYDCFNVGVLSLAKALDSFDPKRNIWFWKYADIQVRRAIYIEFNKIIKKGIGGLRGGSVRKELHFTYIDDLNNLAEISDDEDYFKRLENKDMSEFLYKTLNDKEIGLLDWVYVKNRSQVDYGKSIGKSRACIQSRLHNILKKLKRKLEVVKEDYI